MDETRGEVTSLVERWGQGDVTALDRLIEVAYDDLRQIASQRLHGWRHGQTIETTGLVHELYLRLAGVSEGAWGGRAQFFAFCSKAMRRILIDFARRRAAAKRGGESTRVPLDHATTGVEMEAVELIALDDALRALATRDERMARIVECRFFGGLSVVETAEAVDASTRTVEREWARARTYLRYLLTAEPDAGDEAAS